MEKIMNVLNSNKGIIKKVIIGGIVAVGLKLVANAVMGSGDADEDYIDAEATVISEEETEAE